MPRLFHEIITELAANSLTKDKVALVYGQASFTYAQLEKAANLWATALVKRGVKPHNKVAVLLPPSPEQLLLLLATSRIGVTYVPLDPQLKCPLERITRILRDSEPTLLVTTHDVLTARGLEHPKDRTLALEDFTPIVPVPTESPVMSPDLSDADAYIVYTSGTTGEPKGVPIGHSGMVDYWFPFLRDHIDLGNSSRIASVISPAFDANIWEFLVAAASKGTLVIAEQSVRDDLNQLKQFIKTHKITAITLVPAQLRAWDLAKDLLELKKTGLQTVFSTGEACTADIVNAFDAAGVNIVNCYGPTELTFGLSAQLVTVDAVKDKMVPISLAHSDEIKLYLMDENTSRIKPLEAAKAGEQGVLLFDSPYMTRGYLNRPEDTKKNFIEYTAPNSTASKKLYNSGDVVKVEKAEDGKLSLFYLRRSSDSRSLKINGVLVNLNESESQIRAIPAIQNAAVVAVKNRAGQRRLVAFIHTVSDEPINVRKIRRVLEETLVPVAIPTHYYSIESLPLTTNGKLDYEKLKSMAEENIQKEYESAPENPPQIPLQEKLSDIWKGILGITNGNPIDIDTTFEEFGGTSIQIAKLVYEVNRAFSISSSTVDMTKYGFSGSQGIPFTIRNLARYIHTKRWEKLPSSTDLLMGTDTSDKTPVFLVPALTGESDVTYAGLAQELQEILDTNIYGLSCRGLYEPYDIHDGLEEWAKDLANSITKNHPKGKVILLGWSLGGVLALKIAEILEKKNRVVEFIGMIDSASPLVYQKMSEEEYAKEIIAIANQLGEKILKQTNILTLRVDSLAKYTKEEQIDLVFNELLGYANDDDMVINLLTISKVNLKSILTCAVEGTRKPPNSYNTKASEKQFGDSLGWRLRKGITLSASSLLGDHFSIIDNPDRRRPLIQALTDDIKEWLTTSPTLAVADVTAVVPQLPADLAAFLQQTVIHTMSQFYGVAPFPGAPKGNHSPPPVLSQGASSHATGSPPHAAPPTEGRTSPRAN